ncbi:MAG: hypothetical protein V3T57_04835 [Kiloniellales bacterium]
MRTVERLEDYEITSAVDLDRLATEDLELMVEAGRQVVEIYRVLAKTGDNVVGELLRGYETFYEWDHYPKGDVYDRETHAQYYYHAHVVEQRFPNEHGHFHTFVRPKGMPPGIKPADVPERVEKDDPNDELSHLIAIAMTSDGFPFRLFSTNRWVTGETWYRAKDVCVLLDYFEIDHAQPSWPVNRWISAMIRLFKPQIAELLHARDRAVEDWARHRSGSDVFEDRDLEVTAYMEVSVEDQVRAISKALLKRR